MEVIEYLTFVGKLKGIPASDLNRRIDEVVGRCAIGDVARGSSAALQGLPPARGLGPGHHPQSPRS